MADVLKVGDETYQLNADGYLEDLTQWTPTVAKALAEKDGITLIDGHWDIINFLRDYHIKYDMLPPIKTLIDHVMNQEKVIPSEANLGDIYKLFGGNVFEQGSKYGGLPKYQCSC